MNDDQYWGKSPWKADELHDASIECAWVDKSIRWIGIGTLKVKESCTALLCTTPPWKSGRRGVLQGGNPALLNKEGSFD